MVEDHTALAMVILGIVGVVGLVGLFMFMSSKRQQGSDSGVMIVEALQPPKDGWMIIQATSLAQAGFKQVA